MNTNEQNAIRQIEQKYTLAYLQHYNQTCILFKIVNNEVYAIDMASNEPAYVCDVSNISNCCISIALVIEYALRNDINYITQKLSAIIKTNDRLSVFSIGDYTYHLYNTPNSIILMAAPLNDEDSQIEVFNYNLMANKITNEDCSYYPAIMVAGLLQYVVFK